MKIELPSEVLDARDDFNNADWLAHFNKWLTKIGSISTSLEHSIINIAGDQPEESVKQILGLGMVDAIGLQRTVETWLNIPYGALTSEMEKHNEFDSWFEDDDQSILENLNSGFPDEGDK